MRLNNLKSKHLAKYTKIVVTLEGWNLYGKYQNESKIFKPIYGLRTVRRCDFKKSSVKKQVSHY
jgi:hypothetical protein